MRTVALLFLLTASLPSFSQGRTPSVDPRWSLTLPDSMVHGPYNDFRLMAANRLVSDQLRREAVWNKHAWMNVAEQERKKAEVTNNALDLSQKQVGILSSDNLELRSALMSCQSSVAGYRMWATIGKFCVIGGGVILVGSAILATANAVK